MTRARLEESKVEQYVQKTVADKEAQLLRGLKKQELEAEKARKSLADEVERLHQEKIRLEKEKEEKARCHDEVMRATEAQTAKNLAELQQRADERAAQFAKDLTAA